VTHVSDPLAIQAQGLPEIFSEQTAITTGIMRVMYPRVIVKCGDLNLISISLEPLAKVLEVSP